MRLRAEIASWTAITVLLLVLILLSTSGSIGMILALIVALGLTVIVALGPDRTGLCLLVAALAAAPLNAFRPPGAGVVTYSDLFFVLGFGLLLPRLLRNRPALPPLYYVGGGLFVVGGICATALMSSPVVGLLGVTRFAIAALVLPLAMSMLRPTNRMLSLLAAAYVGGQVVSTAYAYLHPVEVQGRSFGWTMHPNFFGMGGHTAFALLIFLFYRIDRRYRWTLLVPAAIVGQSVLMSGSRASLICIALMAAVWPLVERTAISWYLIVSVGVVGLAVANPILQSAGQGSALARIQGGASGAASDSQRVQALTTALREFLHHPLIGNGFTPDTLDTHNAYLEAGVGGGILAMLGFIIIMGCLVAPLFRDHARNRLAFAALAYAAFAMIGPSLWDRIVWAALALVFVTPTDSSPVAEEPVPALSGEGLRR